ncbi:oxidoreductase, short chain dehydrogenase/reductase family [hydrocarbon metagenome]|uniref:Oxidoreductase, short chain dehydrogenase/reductase family n=1 Tax=hydrocarbon metagenome TaxID=938273 RepID=A0A0W8FQL5_9ZZZZ
MVLARKGWKILIADISHKGMEETLAMVRQAGGDGEVFECDVSKPENVKAMADYSFSKWGKIDLLINNAGVVSCGFVDDIPLEDWHWCVDINFWGMLYGCHSFIPHMKTKGGGHIINVASSAGLFCLMEMGPYNVTKAAVISLSETLRQELVPYKIGVTVACPMFFNTHLLDNMRYQDQFQSEFAHSAFEHGRLSAEEVAERTIRAYEKNKLYVIPQFSGKYYWILKRLSPSFFYGMISYAVKKGYGEKLALFLTRIGMM